MQEIIIKGAKVNNLKNVSLTLPRDKFIVFTGLSGSGKSSLAFDTIYAEGQRRYVESLSTYARQFLGEMDKPDVELIEGLSPAISIDQKTTSRNPRSTVGTVTEIYDYFRLLYARIGEVRCPVCNKPIHSQSTEEMVDRILKFPDGTRLQILAPVVRGKKGEHKKVFEVAKKEGFVRMMVDGDLLELEEDIVLEKNKKHDISIVVDRIIVREGMEEDRLFDSLNTALEMAEGTVLILSGEGEAILMSEHFACIEDGISFEEPTTATFSFNSPFGMCPTCSGLGFSIQADEELIIPDKSLSFNEGAIAPFATAKEGTYYYEFLKAIFDRHNFSLEEPIKNAPKELIDDLLYGTDWAVEFTFQSYFSSGVKRYKRRFTGIKNIIEERYEKASTQSVEEKIGEYMSEISCPDCNGKRLKPSSLSVYVGGLNIIELTELSVKDEINFFENLKLTETEEMIAHQILIEIKGRLDFLKTVGLDYLNLSRMAGTLSGGEAQRIRLATQIGSGLVGVVYVLDEPSIGLHQRDNDKLLSALRHLTDIGNTLIVVEHDEDTMRKADFIVDIGPGAGINGGEIVFSGTPEELMKCKKSITGEYLSGAKSIPVPTFRRTAKDDKYIKIINPRENNLKGMEVKIPLGVFTCVTGVSGSGKSSLINQILFKYLSVNLNRARQKIGKVDKILGLEHLDKVIDIDQSPIGRTPRSNPATYTGLFDIIRDLFAKTNEAKMRGYKKGRFSFNVKGGRCEACKGDGIKKVEMHFLPDVYVPCEICKGARYNRDTLEIKYKGKNVSDVLNMTVEEGLEFFSNIPRIKSKLQTISDVGLGYIKIGQPSTELSGGEAQRVKLATELSRRATGRTIYILDEPTTGLHSYDIHKLVEVLMRLVDEGNTVVVIEHNLDVIKMADYIIDLGPEGGDLGGNIVALGTPEEVALCEESYTGQFLKKILK